MLQRAPLADCRSPEGREPDGLPDVRLLVPGDDRLQRHQAAHAIEVHLRSRRRQPAIRAARRRVDHRRADGRLRVADGALPRRWGAADHPGRHGGLLLGVLVPVPDRRDVGVGRVLRRRAASRQSCSSASSGRSPTSSTTRARPSGCSGSSAAARRSAASSGRRSRPTPRSIGTDNLILLSAALMALCAVLVVAIIRRERVEADRRSPRSRRKRASARPKRSSSCASRSTCRSSRSSSASPRSARRSSSSSSTWRPQAAKGAGATDSITEFLAQVGLWTSIDRLRDPGLADQPDPPLSRHRLRADGAAGQPRHRPRWSCC